MNSFSYPQYLYAGKKTYWNIEDMSALSQAGPDEINPKLKEIALVLIEKCDHMFVHKTDPRRDYELFIAYDALEDGCYTHARIDILREINAFPANKIRIYFTKWADMPEIKDAQGESEIDYDGGEYHYLSEFIAKPELFQKFIGTWSKFSMPKLKDRSPDMTLIVRDKKQVEEAMKCRWSQLKDTQTKIDEHLEMSKMACSIFDSQLDKMKQFRNQMRLMEDATLVLIKPLAFSRGLTNSVLDEFTKRGYKLMYGGQVHITKAQAEEHYAEHRGKPFFDKITTALASGPLFVVIISHDTKETVSNVRKLIGATDPKAAEAGTIRAKYGTSIDDNVVHASDSSKSAKREVKFWAQIVLDSKKK